MLYIMCFFQRVYDLQFPCINLIISFSFPNVDYFFINWTAPKIAFFLKNAPGSYKVLDGCTQATSDTKIYSSEKWLCGQAWDEKNK